MFDAAPLSTSSALQQSEELERALALVKRPAFRLSNGALVFQRNIGPFGTKMIARHNADTPQAMQETLCSISGNAPVIITPEQPMALQTLGAIPLVSATTHAVLDVSLTVDALMAGLHQKWRNRFRHAQRQNLRIKTMDLPDDPTHWLLQADCKHQREHGYQNWPVGTTLAYARANTGDAKLFTATLAGSPVAGVLILRHGTSATYHIGHTTALGRKTSAHTLLIWSAILWAKTQALQRLELGTVDTEQSPGLARFKLGTGAAACTLGGTWLWWPPLTTLLRPLVRLDRSLMLLS